MAKTIEFFYEFSSPYGYLAANLIDAIAEKHGCEVNWRPFLLGAVFKSEGTQPLLDYPMKGDYSKRDMERSARLYGLPMNWPPRFPMLTVNAARVVYWAGDLNVAWRRRLSRALYHAAYGDGRDIGKVEEVLAVCEAEGLDPQEVQQALGDQRVKDRLRDETQAAIDLKVFGSPFMIVDGEPFWGVDRLDQLDRWLETGGW
ncbi:2-hydroxychromene-2-carboxylate isomerase [Aestuariispira ectoiniformans]|uniref:2-hydroxychromene-2-carboxylate isomerase n=1 Tax=Aestuariispira ectoiniformans TaxID=2775080 RepID=UPI00223ACC01|nr:2-hydroxychromene-2-carboxylate isomerase [Aestuariispira ectoiniformans]